MPRGDKGPAVTHIQGRLGIGRDARLTMNTRRGEQGGTKETAYHGYHPRRGGCYDSAED